MIVVTPKTAFLSVNPSNNYWIFNEKIKSGITRFIVVSYNCV